GQILRAGEDVTARVAVIGAAIANDLTGAGHRAIGRLHRHLGPAVPVIVVHLELGVVRAGSDVSAQVDAPQSLPAKGVRIDIDEAGDTGLGVVPRLRTVPLEDDFQLAVAVEVADAAVVG